MANQTGLKQSVVSNGDKFYTGSSKSNPWVKDLLWKLYIENEGKAQNLPERDQIDSLPAHMQSVAYAGVVGAEAREHKTRALMQESGLDRTPRMLSSSSIVTMFPLFYAPS
jgi:hypothetical protein